jgi:hypothetical protein
MVKYIQWFEHGFAIGHVYPLDVFKQGPWMTVGAEGSKKGRR